MNRAQRYICLPLTALLLGALSATAVGCGGSEKVSDDTPTSTGDVSIPTDGYPTNTLTTDTGVTVITDGTDSTVSTDDQPSSTDTSTVQDTSGGPASTDGGAQSPSDSATNDTPPPKDSPAEKFEEFCRQNPGAC